MVRGREIGQFRAQTLVQKRKGNQLRVEEAGRNWARGQVKTAKWEYGIVEAEQQDASGDREEEKAKRKSKEKVESSHLAATWKRSYSFGGETSLRDKLKIGYNTGSKSHPRYWTRLGIPKNYKGYG